METVLKLLRSLLAYFQRPKTIPSQPIPITERREIMSDNIRLEEINPHRYFTTPEIDYNLSILHNKINKVRDLYNKPMIVTSGLRSIIQQNQLIADGKSTATKSKHLTGQAIDIADKNGELRDWIIANMDQMASIGLWFEDFDHTPGWIHAQIVPPGSGKRVFIP